MSSDEEQVHSSDEEEKPSGPSEAELAMQKKKAMEKLKSVKGLTDEDQEMLAANQVDRDVMATEITQMKQRSDKRKKERETDEKRIAGEREAEEQRRKAEEDERKRKKEEEEMKRRAEREEKMAEFKKWENQDKPNFVISKRSGPVKETGEGEEDDAGVEKKSREQLEAEKKAILSQRIQPLNIDGADSSKLTEKAKELQALIMRLESEKYDLEKRFKGQQVDMMELADKARQMNKIGRSDGLKRASHVDDKMAERFAGCPSKIVMYSEFERQKDSREYGVRQTLFTGPVYGHAAERVKPCRTIIWNESTGLPNYQSIPGAEPREKPAEEGEEEEEEE